MDPKLPVGEGVIVGALVICNARNGEVGVSVGVAVGFEIVDLFSWARMGRKVGVGATRRVNGKLQAAETIVKIAAKKKKYLSLICIYRL